MNPTRILHIISDMDMGGAQTMIMNLYRKIDKSLFQFDFLVSEKEECFYDNEIKQLGGELYHTVTKSTKPLRYCKDLWKLLKQNKYNIVHTHASNSMAVIPVTVAMLAGVKKRIVHCHTSSGNGKIIVHKAMRPILNMVATDKFTCSDLASEWMYGKKKNEAVVIYNPIDCLAFKRDEKVRGEVRNNLGLKENRIYVHVGRISPPKNHRFLIDLFKEIHHQDPKSYLLLLGSGEMMEEIKEKVSSLNLVESVRFLGNRKDVNLILQACDGFLMPSLYEGLPLALLEAQAAGLRCYVSDVITRQAVITDLVKTIPLTKTPKEWTEIILSDIDQPVDRELSNSIIYDIFDSNTIAQQFIQNHYNLGKMGS